jgi:23S rRNA (cytidine1920-2'-O)/16S rRNA (cytidine1409-2'-O)-methyltransferase
MAKERLDTLVVQKGLAASRERAKALIMAGQVCVDGRKTDKAGTLVPETAAITVTGRDLGYVSRGGLKLAKALETFGIDLAGKVMADIGASTGGFTDCALQNGAAKIYAIDVGYGQLAWSLRTDPRVVNMERTNIRDVTPADIGEPLAFATVDVAFISLDKVLPVVKTLLAPAGEAVTLVKPQFEAGREKVGKRGVVRDAAVHREVILRVIAAARGLGFVPVALTYSPVKGPEGNIEYLLYLKIAAAGAEIGEAAVGETVAEAHAALGG